MEARCLAMDQAVLLEAITVENLRQLGGQCRAGVLPLPVGPTTMAVHNVFEPFSRCLGIAVSTGFKAPWFNEDGGVTVHGRCHRHGRSSICFPFTVLHSRNLLQCEAIGAPLAFFIVGHG